MPALFCGKLSYLTSTCGSHDKVPFPLFSPSWISSRPLLMLYTSTRSLTLIFWAADDLIYFFEFFHDFCRAKETYVMRQIIYHKGTCRHTYIAVYGILHFFKAWAPKLVNELFSCPSFITSSHLSRSKKEEWKELYFLLFFCNAVPNVLFQ